MDDEGSPEMVLDDGRTAEQVRAAIEARVDRTLALEELSWRLHSFIEDLWGPLPEDWLTGVAQLGVSLSRGESPPGESGSSAWESGRARILSNLSPQEAWLVGLSDWLWDHAFDRARETIRIAAVESFLQATLAYIADNPDVPPMKPPGVAAPDRTVEAAGAIGDVGVTKPT
jgi:hypothetical protein